MNVGLDMDMDIKRFTLLDYAWMLAIDIPADREEDKRFIIIIIIIIITNDKIAVTFHKRLQGHFTQSSMRAQKTKHLAN